MEALQKELVQAIDNHLPSAIGEQLRKRLEDAKRLDAENEKLRTANGERIQEIHDLKSEISRHKALNERELAIEKQKLDIADRLRHIETREHALESTLAEQRAEAANDKCHAIYTLAEIALGKRSYTERITRKRDEEVPDKNNSYGGTRTLNHRDETEVHREEIG
jgi:hypothetical protein